MPTPDMPTFEFAAFSDAFVVYLQAGLHALAPYPWPAYVLWALAILFIGKVAWRIRREDAAHYAEADARQARADAWDRSWDELQRRDRRDQAARDARMLRLVKGRPEPPKAA